MEQKKQTIAERAKGLWVGLNKAAQISIIAVISVLLVLIIFLLVSASKVEYEVLLTGLSPQDASDATVVLGDLGITDYYVEGVSSVTIYVPAGTRASTLLQMQGEGYPASSSDLYNLYLDNAMGMGSTDQDKRVIEAYGLEQRTAYLIKQMDKVKDATVVINLAEQSQFALSERNKPASASVVLTLESGEGLTPEEAESVRRIVMTAVPGLLAENCTISDTAMRTYDVNDGTATGAVYTADQITLQLEHQQLIEEQVHNFLDPVFGTGNVVVTASVELDFDKKSSQSVTYAPPGDADNMGIIVSLQQAAERAGVAEMAEGVAGFDANGAAPFYPEDLTGDTAPVYNYSQQLNAEVNEVREQIEEAQGKVTRLSVSIMIDADEGLDEELENIRALVANGLGVSTDYISIMRRSFQINEQYEAMLEEQAQAEQLAAEEEAADRERLILLAIIIAVAVVVLVVVLILLNARKKRKEMEAQLAALEEERALEAQKALEEAAAREMIGELEDSASAGRLRTIQDLAKENPEMIAQMLRNWLTDDFH